MTVAAGAVGVQKMPVRMPSDAWLTWRMLSVLNILYKT